MKYTKMKVWSVLAVIAMAMVGVAQAQPIAEGQNNGALGTGSLEVVTTKRSPTSSLVGPNEDAYNVQLWAVRLPLRTNENWETKAAILMNKLIADRMLTNDVGYRLLTTDITQMRPARTNESLWFTPRIAKKGTNKVSLTMTRFTQHSSDSADSLANVYNLVGGNFEYSPLSPGFIWGPHGEWGPRSEQTVITNGPGDFKVDEIIFPGVQSTYYGYDNQSGYDSIDSYVHARHLKLMTWVEVVGTAGTVLATAARTLQENGVPVTPRLIVERVGGEVIITFPTLETNRSAILLGSPVVGTGAGWNTIATVNVGDEIVRSSGFGNLFFKLLLQ